MRRAARLQNDDAGLLLLEERDQVVPLQLALQLQLSGLVNGVNMENGLGGIQADHGNTHRGRLPSLQVLTTRTCGTPMPSGVVHPIWTLPREKMHLTVFRTDFVGQSLRLALMLQKWIVR